MRVALVVALALAFPAFAADPKDKAYENEVLAEAARKR